MDEHAQERPSEAGRGRRRWTRREFLISLGAGAASAIAGYYLVRSHAPRKAAAPQGRDARPRLRPDLLLQRRDDLLLMREPDGNQCGVNAAGAEIVDRLDGRHTIDDIGAALANRFDIDGGEPLSAKVALFVAQLGELGLLAEPFYARIVYQETDA